MSTTTNPKCPICASSADADPKDFERVMYFKCDGDHEFIVRVDVIQRLTEASEEVRNSMAVQLSARNDSYISQISNNNGALEVKLVERSKWLS